MNFYSTNHQAANVNFEKAIFQGLPEDNGLYMPERIPQLPEEFFSNIDQLQLHEIAYKVIREYAGEEIEAEVLRSMLAEVYNFDIPLVEVEENIYSLELFHGPTCAFKDVGARFLARSLGYFAERKGSRATILVATSGDTGSAVAHGFLGVPNINVVILYPQGKVSEVQEKQLTTLGQNITAVEVKGTFDDCQALVKKSFLDRELKESLNLTSANSINIARLLPQSIYYFWAFAQLKSKGLPLVISVPSGNYGNLTAGLLAKAMGLPVKKFIAASNANDVVPEYLLTKNFRPRPSIQTYSNAMDVGDPSNFSRMMDLYGNDWDKITRDILAYHLDDAGTLEVMRDCHSQNDYLTDPHGAIGYQALKENLQDGETGVFLETAHPAKFGNVVEMAGLNYQLPDRLAEYLEKEKEATLIDPDFDAFTEFLKDHASVRD